MTDEQLAAAKVKVMALPAVLGAVVPVYNIPGVNKELNFSGDVIADIYLGKITNWNDPRIAKDNPGVNLPDNAILPVYRSDGSGTTFIFTDFLSKVCLPGIQEQGRRGAAVKWPTGIGQKGNEGVAGMVRQSPNSFGYVELIYAVQNKMSYGSVKNASGKYREGKHRRRHRRCSGCRQEHARRLPRLDHQCPGRRSYPISSFTWLLIPTHSLTPPRPRLSSISLAGCSITARPRRPSLTYAPLPKQVQDMVRKSITHDQIAFDPPHGLQGNSQSVRHFFPVQRQMSNRSPYNRHLEPNTESELCPLPV